MDANTLHVLENEIYVEHPIAQEVEAAIFRFMQYGRQDESLCVVGPTGVGKSRMSRLLINKMISRLDSGWRQTHSYPLYIEAPSQSKREFPWRSFLEDLLLLLGEVNLKVKIDVDAVRTQKQQGIKPPSTSRLTIGQLERLVRLRINVIKPITIIIDQSQNFVEGLSLNDRKANVNRLKNWANTMDTKFILFGTHESRELLNLNEQLSRRITPVYFPRYAKNTEEMKEFASFYLGLVDALELNLDPRINEDFTFIYNHSLGCPGLLATWIYNSISQCITEKQSKISFATFNRNKMSRSRLAVMEKAIKSFEVEYHASLVNFNPDEIQADEGPSQLDMNFSGPVNKQRNGKPGKQHPRRFPTHEV